MNVLSLCAGIGGLDLGLERAGMTVVGQVEIDPFCQQILTKNFPGVPLHDDVRTAVAWWRSVPARPRVDLVAAGFPCQDISNAGPRGGITGARSGLWAAVRDTVRDLRPDWVLLENVTAILVRGLDVVAANLHEVGYDLRWDCVPAAAVGAPHRRDRWFGIAHANGQQLRVEPVSERLGGSSAPVADADGSSRFVADAAGERRRQGRPGRSVGDGSYWARIWPQALADASSVGRGPRAGQYDDAPQWGQGHGESGRGGWWATEPDVGRVAHGVPARMDRLRALGNAVVPQVSEYVGRLIVNHAEAVAA